MLCMKYTTYIWQGLLGLLVCFEMFNEREQQEINGHSQFEEIFGNL